MKSIYFILASAFLSAIVGVNGLKILSVLPFGSKSHFAGGYEIIKTLVTAGHKATIIAPYKSGTPLNNLREIFIPEILEIFENNDEFDPFVIHKLPQIMVLPILHGLGKKLLPVVMEHPKVVEFMKNEEKYDVCFLEVFHASALTGIYEHVGCKIIFYSTAAVTQWANVWVSNQSPSSYVVTPMLPYDGKMNFKQRFINTVNVLIEDLSFYLYHLPMQRQLYQKYFPNAKKSHDEVAFNPSLIFISNHHSLTGARPYLPNMIEIGGIHIPAKKEIPQDLKKFLSFSEGGFIVFSMGSIVKAHQFPEKTREALVSAFGKLKQKVIWRYENETLPNKPDNVMISSWLPQRDLLAHPNCALFITHGGFLGTTEAASEGVPMLGLPMFGDQGMNLAYAVDQGRAISLEIGDITEELITSSINELLNNPKYAENAKKTKKIFHDRPMTPQVSVTYWTDFIARHDGAPFLRAAGSDLNAFEFHLIDVYAAILAIVLVILWVNFVILRAICRKVFCGKSKEEKAKKVKKN